MSKKLYKKITDELVNSGYIIIPHAMHNSLQSQLLTEAKETTNYKKASIARAVNKQIDSEKRRDSIRWLDRDDGAQSEFLNFTDGLGKYLNRELFIGIQYFESHFAIYEEGDFYETHLDDFKDSKNRVVTIVYYLNENWVNGDGGELVVYDEKNNFLAKVAPHADTMVIFLSDIFPHEVLKANKIRYSVAGWFRLDGSVS
ncbi:MAG: 2OG-Fe(II) oxygenase [Campylobacterales bacterium]|nr:2OG-Fe(II) oxygenase [Campylobacterales bacterium]